MKILKKLLNTFDRTNDVLAVLAIALLVFVMLIICGEVINRYLLGGTLKWVVEVTEYSIVYIAFLATAWLLRQDGHVKVELILNYCNPRTQSLINVITSGMAAIACLLIAFFSAQSTLYHFQDGILIPSLLRPAKWIMLAVIPVGSFLLFVQFVIRSYGYMQSWRVTSDKNRL